MGILDAPFRQTKDVSRRHTFLSGVAHLTQNNDAVNGLSFRVAHAFLSPPTAVRAIFYNHLVSTITFAQHWAATAQTKTATLSPATSSEWTAGGSVTCAAAIDTINVNPSLTYGPWIPVYPQECTDAGGAGTYRVMIQAVLQPANAQYWSTFEDLTWRASEPLNTGLYWEMRQQSGSDPLANPGLFSDTNVRTRSAIAGMEALCEDGTVIITDFGDSIMAGAGQTLYGKSDVYRAVAALNQGGAKISYMRNGFGGQNSLGYFNRCVSMLPIIKPDILIFSAGTPNDGVPSLSGQRANRSQILQVIELARSQGCKVIIRGWAPHSVVADNWPEGTLTTVPTGSVSGDIYRRDQNARMSKFDGKGGVFWTPGPAALGDGAHPERYAVQYTDDTNHPNDAGYAAITAATQTAIQRVLAGFR